MPRILFIWYFPFLVSTAGWWVPQVIAAWRAGLYLQSLRETGDKCPLGKYCG